MCAPLLCVSVTSFISLSTAVLLRVGSFFFSYVVAAGVVGVAATATPLRSYSLTFLYIPMSKWQCVSGCEQEVVYIYSRV